jgi:hypothetical protein
MDMGFCGKKFKIFDSHGVGPFSFPLSLSLSLSLSLKATLLSCSERVTIVPDVTSGPGAAVTPLLQINEVGHFYC